MASYGIYSLVSSFAQSCLCSLTMLFLNVAIGYSFSLLCNSSLYKYTTIYLFCSRIFELLPFWPFKNIAVTYTPMSSKDSFYCSASSSACRIVSLYLILVTDCEEDSHYGFNVYFPNY